MKEEELRKIPYLTHIPRDGRQIKTTAYYDEPTGEWIFMFPAAPDEIGRIAGGAPVRAEYFARQVADSTRDIELPLSTLICQRLSWPEVMMRLEPIESDIHLFCDILEKFELISHRASNDSFAAYLAASELEFLIRVVRSTYDQLQKLAKALAATIVKPDGSGKQLMKGLPDSFADVSLKGEVPRSQQEIENKYDMPAPMASFTRPKRRSFRGCGRFVIAWNITVRRPRWPTRCRKDWRLMSPKRLGAGCQCGTMSN